MCLSHNCFSVALIKCPGKNKLREKGFVLSYGSREGDMAAVREGMVAVAGSWLLVTMRPHSARVNWKWSKATEPQDFLTDTRL